MTVNTPREGFPRVLAVSTSAAMLFIRPTVYLLGHASLAQMARAAAL